MDVYSVTLLSSLVCIALAAITFFVARWRKLSRTFIAIAILFLLTSMIVHRIYGHGEGSPEPMRALNFFSQHPAFLISGAATILLLFLSALRVGSRTTE